MNSSDAYISSKLWIKNLRSTIYDFGNQPDSERERCIAILHQDYGAPFKLKEFVAREILAMDCVDRVQLVCFPDESFIWFYIVPV